MSAPDELGDEFVSKKVLQALGIDVPEDALGFYVKDKTLYIEAMQTGDDPGPLMIMVDTVEVPLSDEQVQCLKDGGFYSSKGFLECPLSLFITLVAGWIFPGNTGERSRTDTHPGKV